MYAFTLTRQGIAFHHFSRWRPIFAASFVGDFGLVLVARMPADVDVAFVQLMTILSVAFGQCHWAIKWAKDKTECLLKYRGTGARRAREARRREGGELAI